MRVAVAGAGVTGLTTALVLQRAGHEVDVFAARSGLESTSGAAGAIWLPVRVTPGGRELDWASRSYRAFMALAGTDSSAGVDVLRACEVVDDDERPWWGDAVDGLRLVPAATIYPRARQFWSFFAPRIEPAVYLSWLAERLTRPVVYRTLANLSELDGEVVVNCTGLGARALCADSALVAVLGQTAVVAPGTLRMDTFIGDERDQAAIFYAIPRRHQVVLGGCRTYVDLVEPPPPDPVLREAILSRCRAAGYEPGPVLAERTGLRPVRPSVRLEREGRIVHNYGHGGAGYTLSWGCAEAVAALLGELA
ncbi:MAG: FAD-binding oxidoreductase [Dehalococcoidia bacterium]|nr:FAD-binding oxidoreductase [Dehalococcoidia bacterium]